MISIDRKLYLADKLIFEPDVHEDIVGSLPQSILDSDYPKEGWLVAAELVEVLKQPEDFLLLRCDLAAHQVADLEADEIRRRSPSRPPYQLLIVDPFGDSEQAVDESVQIQQDVGVQIIDNIDGEDSCSFFYAIHMGEIVSLEGSEQVNSLLIVVILEDLLHELFNFYLFLLNHIVDDGLHPREVSVHVSALLAFDVFSAVQEVIFLLELGPELIAPFREDSEDGWALDDHVLAGYLCLGVLRDVLRDLAADRPRGVALHPLFVLLFVCFFEAVLLVAFLLVLSVLHPVSIFQRHKALLHKIVEILIEGHLPPCFLLDLTILLIQPPDEIIGQLHDQIVVIATLPQLKPITILRVVKYIVLEGLDIVYFFDFALQGVVDDLSLGHRVLGQQVRSDAFFDMLIDALYLGWVETVMFIEPDNIANHIFGAENLGLVVTHTPELEVVKSRREDLAAESSDPHLQLLLLNLLPIFDYRQLVDDGPIPRLHLIGLIALDQPLGEVLKDAQQVFKLRGNAIFFFIISRIIEGSRR